MSDQSKDTDYVEVSLEEFLGLDEIGDFMTLKTEYKIIEKLKEIQEEKFRKLIRSKKGDGLPNIDQMEKHLIEAYIEEYRPEKNWEEIAEMLGVSQKTLWYKRNKHDLS